MLRSMLTTIDNPHNPFDDYKAWFAWDLMHGYNTPSFLARIAQPSDDLSDPDQELAISQAIDEIVRENVLGVYRKLTRDIPEDLIEA